MVRGRSGMVYDPGAAIQAGHGAVSIPSHSAVVRSVEIAATLEGPFLDLRTGLLGTKLRGSTVLVKQDSPHA